MFRPSNHQIDEFEARLGPEHALFEWRGDVHLRGWWPTSRHCTANGWKQKERVALYHWLLIAGKKHRELVHIELSDSWKDPCASLWPEKRYKRPIIIVRVNLRERFSQYLGWITPEELRKVNVINVAFKPTHKVLRRVVLMGQLRAGMPVGVQTQTELFS